MTSLRSGDILVPVTVMKPVIRGSFSPRASSAESSRWNSWPTRAGRSWVLIVVLLRREPFGLRERPSCVLAEVVGVALDLHVAGGHEDLPPVHRGHEVGDPVERLGDEDPVVAYGRDADDALLPEVVLRDLGDRDVELRLHPVDGRADQVALRLEGTRRGEMEGQSEDADEHLFKPPHLGEGATL